MNLRDIALVFGFVLLIALSAYLSLRVIASYQLVSFTGPAAIVDSELLATTTDFAPSGATTLPILVYHVIRPSYVSDSAQVKDIALTPQTFDAELSHLQSAGYHVVSFHDLENYFASSTPFPTKPIILTFDDGWRDQFTYAFPILEKYHDTATFFVFTNAIGNKDFLTWADLQTLVAAGMTIGDHSRSHPYLTEITDPRKLWDEIAGSKALLEQNLQIPVTEFAYPFGMYNAQILSLVQKAGFKSARGDRFSGEEQSPSNLFTLSALNAPTTTAAFARDFP